MVEPLSKSISHAAKSIHKRAENGGDERFSLISAIVLLTGAELLSNPSALDYGRERLRQIVQQAQRSGEFGGYNSPALTLLALEEADFLLSVVNDDVSRQYARQISYIAWRSIAEHHHPATRQWAGPHGWTDQDLFDRAHIEGLASRSSGCPKDLRSRLEALPTAEVTVRHLHKEVSAIYYHPPKDD